MKCKLYTTILGIIF